MSAVLLDTCALIWMGTDASMSRAARTAIAAAAVGDGVFVSPMSAWEIGLLAALGHDFLPDPKAWFTDILRRRGVRLAALTPEIAIDSTRLPEPIHRDPADRMLIATARALGLPLVTRDRKIREYAAAGHVRVILC